MLEPSLLFHSNSGAIADIVALRVRARRRRRGARLSSFTVGIALGRRNHEAGAWKMHTDLADRGFAASDDDLMNARGDQFADDRIASGIIRSNADDLARLPPDGIFRVSGCFRD